MHHKHKSNRIMGTIYRIRCRHCGTQFMHNQGNDYGTISACVGCECHIETETAIRCPACMKRINTTEEEFNRQVETVMIWD